MARASLVVEPSVQLNGLDLRRDTGLLTRLRDPQELPGGRPDHLSRAEELLAHFKTLDKSREEIDARSRSQDLPY